MRTGLKMLASAVVASALTATLFLTLWSGPGAPRTHPPAPVVADSAPDEEAAQVEPAVIPSRRDLPTITGDDAGYDTAVVRVRVLVTGIDESIKEPIRIACTPDHDYLPYAGRHRFSPEEPVIRIRPGRNWLQPSAEWRTSSSPSRLR